MVKERRHKMEVKIHKEARRKMEVTTLRPDRIRVAVRTLKLDRLRVELRTLRVARADKVLKLKMLVKANTGTLHRPLDKTPKEARTTRAPTLQMEFRTLRAPKLKVDHLAATRKLLSNLIFTSSLLERILTLLQRRTRSTSVARTQYLSADLPLHFLSTV
ncbi:unnamed protein product [Aureobasidium pullulans]|nr:unnamed protein product [Aureobasidium pullulans]